MPDRFNTYKSISVNNEMSFPTTDSAIQFSQIPINIRRIGNGSVPVISINTPTGTTRLLDEDDTVTEEFYWIAGGKIPKNARIIMFTPNSPVELLKSDDEIIKVSANGYGICSVEMFDSEYRKDSVNFIVNPRIRNNNGDIVEEVEMLVNETLKLNFYGAMSNDSVIWIDTQQIVEFAPGEIVPPFSFPPFIEIPGYNRGVGFSITITAKEIGETSVSVTGASISGFGQINSTLQISVVE